MCMDVFVYVRDYIYIYREREIMAARRVVLTTTLPEQTRIPRAALVQLVEEVVFRSTAPGV